MKRPWIMLVGDSNYRELHKFIVVSMIQEYKFQTGECKEPRCRKWHEHNDRDCVFPDGTIVSFRFVQTLSPWRVREIFETDWRPRLYLPELEQLGRTRPTNYDRVLEEMMLPTKYEDGPSLILMTFGLWHTNSSVHPETAEVLRRVAVPHRLFAPSARINQHDYIHNQDITAQHRAAANLTQAMGFDFLDVYAMAERDRAVFDVIDEGFHWHTDGPDNCLSRYVTTYLFYTACHVAGVNDSTGWVPNDTGVVDDCSFPGHNETSEFAQLWNWRDCERHLCN